MGKRKGSAAASAAAKEDDDEPTEDESKDDEAKDDEPVKKRHFDSVDMEFAVRKVVEGEPIRKVAREMGFSRNTVRKYVRRLEQDPELMQFGPNYGAHKKLFTDAEEDRLFKHLQKASSVYGGLTRFLVMELGFMFALRLGRKVSNPMGRLGKKWFASFWKRYPQLFLRKADGISLHDGLGAGTGGGSGANFDDSLAHADWKASLKNPIPLEMIFDLDDENLPGETEEARPDEEAGPPTFSGKKRRGKALGGGRKRASTSSKAVQAKKRKSNRNDYDTEDTDNGRHDDYDADKGGCKAEEHDGGSDDGDDGDDDGNGVEVENDGDDQGDEDEDHQGHGDNYDDDDANRDGDLSVEERENFKGDRGDEVDDEFHHPNNASISFNVST